jgi:carboxyl-terminal processing protease
MERVHSSYVKPVTDNELVKDALKGMLTGLDPHSDYMDEREYRELVMQTRGELAGIGAELGVQAGQPIVISPIDDTPAARAGIRAGDVITRIDGQATDDLTLNEVVDRVRGPAGTMVKLTIARANQEPFDVTLTRAIVHVTSVKSHLEAGRIGYARISLFNEHTQSELGVAIAKLEGEADGRLDGFVLDLRNDPGGLLDAAIDVASDFLDGGAVVSTRGREPTDDHVYEADYQGDRLADVPMIVLINGASASAAEIVAGALQDHHRATVIGTRSFGKGSVQSIIPLDGQGALRLTTALYYTPSGRSIQAQGIIPDVTVQAPKDDAVANAGHIVREAELKGAFGNTAAGAAGKPGSATAPRGQAARDSSGSDEAPLDPAIIGTAKDYQLSVAIQKLKEMPGARAAR